MEEEELFGQSGDVLTAQEADELETKIEAAKKDLSGQTLPQAGETQRHG
jgi:hypothetical protein